MVTIRQLLSEKGGEVFFIPSAATVREALQTMAARDIGAILVIDDGVVKGIFSERDFARCTALREELSLDQPVTELMTETVYFADLEQTIDDCMALMTSRRFRHLPVMEGERVVGVVSIGDVVKSVIQNREVTIHGLENYILGRDYGNL